MANESVEDEGVEVFCPPDAVEGFQRIPTGERLRVLPVPGQFQLVRVEIGDEHAVVYAHELYLAIRTTVVEGL